jgi:hypothetical protein
MLQLGRPHATTRTKLIEPHSLGSTAKDWLRLPVLVTAREFVAMKYNEREDTSHPVPLTERRCTFVTMKRDEKEGLSHHVPSATAVAT